MAITPISPRLAQAYLEIVREKIKGGEEPRLLWRDVSSNGGHGYSYQTQYGRILEIRDIGESDPYLVIQDPKLTESLHVEEPKEGKIFYEQHLLESEELSKILESERRNGKDRRNERGRSGGRRLEDLAKRNH